MEFYVETNKRTEMIDITKQVEDFVKDEKDGLVNVYVPHASASVIINENDDPNICLDILNFLEKQIPQGKWKHDIRDGNADSHIKVSILGSSQIIPFKNGKLLLGQWQAIMLVELDGSRKRKIILTKV
ncbi:secondary thiamine-phosphate synthase enzyme YjbQ [archaeon]|nr:secondary thiamine-phosphate synthase enzyme YjbQ [archaeon]